MSGASGLSASAMTNVQRRIFGADMNKNLVAARVLAPLKIGGKNRMHLWGVVSALRT